MAKQQTFQDKLKKLKTETKLNVRVIKAFKGEKGAVKFMERFVKVDDASQIEKIDISR